MITNQYKEDFNAVMGKYRAKAIVDFFSSIKIQSIADVGCGPGDVIEKINDVSDMIKNCTSVFCIDADLKYLDQAKEKFQSDSKFHFIELDVEKNDFPEQKMDLIFLIDILEHLHDPLLMLNKVKNYMTPEGYVVIIVPNANSIHRQIGKEMGFISTIYDLNERDHEVGHQRYFDFNSLGELLAKSGLEIVNKSGILLKFLPNKEMENLSNEYCDALFEVGRNLPEYCGEIFWVCKLNE